MSSSTFYKPSSNQTTTLLRCYLDFDGTLSGRSGSQTVYTDLYRSLQTNPQDAYYNATFCDADDMQKTLEAGLQKDEYKTLRMLSGAIEFLKKMLEAKADIIIISKNREEYINAILTFEGFSKDEIAQIKVYDVNGMNGNKELTAQKAEKEALNPRTEITVICDDDPNDLNGMKKGVEAAKVTKKILSYGAKAGAFKWVEITKEVLSAANLEEKRPSKGLS